MLSGDNRISISSHSLRMECAACFLSDVPHLSCTPTLLIVPSNRNGARSK
jgi:hypothetical protein